MPWIYATAQSLRETSSTLVAVLSLHLVAAMFIAAMALLRAELDLAMGSEAISTAENPITLPPPAQASDIRAAFVDQPTSGLASGFGGADGRVP